MRDGSLRAVEQIAVGDELLGLDGSPRRVLETTVGFGPLFRVRQKSGIDYVANANHVLALVRSKSARLDRGDISAVGNSQRPNGRYARYGDDPSFMTVQEYNSKSERFKCHFFGFKSPAIFKESRQSLDPYFLGLWLGDGDSARPAVTTADKEVVDFLFVFAQRNGMRLSQFGKPDNLASGYLIARINGTRQENEITAQLRELEVLNNKHVPLCYLVASEEQRLNLLAGFIDSDGHQHINGYEIAQSKLPILQQFKFIADSLGFKTSLKRHDVTCKGKRCEAWRLMINGDVWRIPCRVARKIVRRESCSKNKDWCRCRIDIEPIGDGEFFGFELDGDKLFFLQDFTVTHNSHFFAELLIIYCMNISGIRAVCLREVQQSLKQSSKLLIEDKIQLFGVGHLFRVLEDRIETPGGGIIIFQGMQNHTAESIKSLEGYDVAWFDEAHRASQFSLGLLRPTLRKENSELWFSWNPFGRSDPVDELLRGVNKPPAAVVVEANYSDNPVFPDVLREEMEYDRRRDPDRYAHVWMGKYQQESEARVFKNWKVAEFDTPDDARFYFGADWGFSVDPSVLVRCWINGRNLYVDYEAWKIGCDYDHTPALFAGSGARWANPFGWPGIPGATRWPIIADSANPQAIAYMQRMGFSMTPAVKGKGSVEEGVEFLKSYDIVVHPRCVHVIDELSTYSWMKDKRTEQILPKLSDAKNHTIDSLRYAVEPLRVNTYDSSMSWVFDKKPEDESQPRQRDVRSSFDPNDTRRYGVP